MPSSVTRIERYGAAGSWALRTCEFRNGTDVAASEIDNSPRSARARRERESLGVLLSERNFGKTKPGIEVVSALGGAKDSLHSMHRPNTSH